MTNDLPIWVKGLLVLCVILSFLTCKHHYTRHARLHLTLESDGLIQVVYPTETLTGQIVDHSVVTVMLVILYIRTETGQRTVLISRDATDSESFRLLRVSLACMPRTQNASKLS